MYHRLAIVSIIMIVIVSVIIIVEQVVGKLVGVVTVNQINLLGGCVDASSAEYGLHAFCTQLSELR